MIKAKPRLRGRTTSPVKVQVKTGLRDLNALMDRLVRTVAGIGHRSVIDVFAAPTNDEVTRPLRRLALLSPRKCGDRVVPVNFLPKFHSQYLPKTNS
jgi:hypothetical protein